MEELYELRKKKLISWIELSRLAKALSPLHSAVGLKSIFNRAVRAGLIIAYSQRCCLITWDKTDGFVLRDGAPEVGHKIGPIVRGTKFLKAVLKTGKYKIINNVSKEPGLAYMSELIRTYNISAIFFMPLFYGGEEFGMLVFDKTNRRKFSTVDIRKIEILAKHTARALWCESKRQCEENEAVENASLQVLGRHSAAIAHSLRHPLVAIGGTAITMKKHASDSNIVKGCEDIISEVQRTEILIRDVMRYTKISSQKMEFRPCFLNDFLKTVLNSIFGNNRYGCRLELSWDQRLSRTHVQINEHALRIAIEDIVRNALEAGANIIKIKTKISHTKEYAGMTAMITIANNGEALQPEMVDKIFEVFMSTKTDGTGLGLANAGAIIMRHHGKIWAEGKDDEDAMYRTKFKICLPIKNAADSERRSDETDCKGR